MKLLALIFACLSVQCAAYLGSFDPYLKRPMTPVHITLIDTQLVGPSCAFLSAKTGDPLAPVMLLAEGCTLLGDNVIVYPVSFGLWSLYNMSNLIAPDAGLGHEFRHVFDGQFHPAMLPFVDLHE